MSRPIDHTHDAGLTSWVDGADTHPDFPVQNLPLGVFSPAAGGPPRIGAAIGDRVADLRALAAAGLLPDEAGEALGDATLNRLLGSPGATRLALRHRLSALLSDAAYRAAVAPHLHAAEGATLHLPCAIGDYTDFYAGVHHAQNVGRQFRPDSPLLPNYKHVPIGYHGRASSVRASGAPVVRPNGQTKAPDADVPRFGPSRRLDYELELAVWVGPGNALGEAVPIARAADHIAGFGLLNDWSARDIQAWEYQPLGPFLAKNFLTTVSPWVITVEALSPFRLAQPPRPDGDPAPMPYLLDAEDQASGALALTLEAHLTTAAMRAAGAAPHRLSRGPATSLYWTAAQMLAHHASGGCNLVAGDLLGTGTISAASDDGFGSLLEIGHGGKRPLRLQNGETRTFLEDGDEVTLAARAQAPGRRSIGFGPCQGTVQRPQS